MLTHSSLFRNDRLIRAFGQDLKDKKSIMNLLLFKFSLSGEEAQARISSMIVFGSLCNNEDTCNNVYETALVSRPRADLGTMG